MKGTDAAVIQNAYSGLLKEKNLGSLMSNSQRIALKGLVGSSLSFVLADIFSHVKGDLLIVMNDKEEAAYLQNDLELLRKQESVLFYPASYRRPYQFDEIDNANVLLRAEVLNALQSKRTPVLVVTYPEALTEKVVSRKTLKQKTFKLSKGDILSLDALNERLFAYDFKRVDFVSEPGEFSVRGGIVDVFSFAHDTPYRIEFFGDEIDSIRTFDIETQLSIDQLESVDILPNLKEAFARESRVNFFEFLEKNTWVYIHDRDWLRSQLDIYFEKATEAHEKLDSPLQHARPEDLFATGDSVKSDLAALSLLVAAKGLSREEAAAKKYEIIEFQSRPQPPFNKNFDLLLKDLQENAQENYINYICCATQAQVTRFNDIFEEIDSKAPYKTLVLSIHEGFVDESLKIACYTDHQIFERYHKFRIKNGYAKKQAISLNELSKLEVGDFVTHIDHGIGKYGGLKKIEVEGKMQEAIKLLYGDRDILYVSIHSLHKISKYNGKDGAVPKIYKLGSAAWKKLKHKTKTRVKKIAFDLIKVYATRRMKKGFQYSPDTYLQHELEASFLYEDTPDQGTATEDIKRDMESIRPMDRLICGDVGFGKTEIAIRAAFKAADNGKQVAILVPTTILAFQHYRTFTERLKDMPVRVDYLNRFRSAKEKREILESLENGSLEIIIGTHQLANKNVRFKDLGLLIVDEEQKFGVSVKDKLKSIKTDVDVLTLTATPIPRTLQFSLMAARDLSVINTPPPNRYPIDSQVIRFDQETIRDAISYEMQRGGQVFFVHNRIQNIKEIAGLVQRLVPDARVRVGHGQMEGKKLESLMMDFMNGVFDVLVSTTIVESGLDVPNANTIFINYANNFGLSDLHQMRGRVGRSNKKAFCYFITPPYEAMTPDARKRIMALEQFTQLGSGFNIAMKDLEIRGAGDLLGAEQSGFINEIGFQAYQEILNEAIEELKENEFKDVFEEPAGKKQFVKDIQIDSDQELLIPSDYINNVQERMHLYTELNKVSDEQELQKFEMQLTDRFGPIPSAVDDLLQSVRLKWLGKDLGFERIIFKKGKFTAYFISDQESPFFQTKTFTNILRFVQQNSPKCSVKEKQTRKGLRLLLSIDNTKSISEVIEFLKPLAGQEKVLANS